MVSYRTQRLLIVLTLFVSTVFLYGCSGGSANTSIASSTIRLEIRDITTKAPLDNVQVMVSGPDPQNPVGPVSILRQVKTDSRGKVTVGDLPPDRSYRVAVSKEGYQTPPQGNNNVQPQFIPDITGGLTVEQGRTYDVVGYLIRANSPATGTIRGYVKNRVTGEPISNATVFTDQTGSVPAVIDTTDKPSKPGYYELANVPSGQNIGLHATIPGLTTQPNIPPVTVPANGTIDYDIMVDPGTGSIKGTLMAAPNEILAPGIYVIQVLRNGTDIVASLSQAIADNTSLKSQSYEITDVPVILSGSTATYTVKVVTDVAHMINPAGGVSGVSIRAGSQKVEVPTITMQAEKGTLLVTLYHAPVTLVAQESDTSLSTMAPQASITVQGAIVECIFVNEGPTRFYRYRLNNVPVGKRSLTINFPGHNVASPSVTVVKDSEIAALFTLAEGAGGGGTTSSRQ